MWAYICFCYAFENLWSCNWCHYTSTSMILLMRNFNVIAWVLEKREWFEWWRMDMHDSYPLSTPMLNDCGACGNSINFFTEICHSWISTEKSYSLFYTLTMQFIDNVDWSLNSYGCMLFFNCHISMSVCLSSFYLSYIIVFVVSFKW